MLAAGPDGHTANVPVELAPAMAAPASVERRGAPAHVRIGIAPIGVFLAWTVFGLLFSFAVYWEVRTHGHSPSRIVAYTLLVWYWWAAVTPAVAWLGRRVPILPLSWRAAAVHMGAAIATGVVHGVWWTALSVWLKPFDSMGLQVFWPDVVSLVRGRMFFEVMIYAALLAGSLLVVSQQRLRERDVAAAQLETSLAQARLHALELQIQPHFLFNTLHAIGGLVRQSRSTEAVEMIAGLSELLRYSLDHAGGHVVPLGRELDVLGRYLGIQQLRIGDRLSIEIDVPAELRAAAVPAMILQPLAENAIRHGIDTSPGSGRLRLSGRREGDALALELFNTSGAVSFAHAGVGLRNTKARLRQLYGDRSSFTLEGGRHGVTARLTLPYEEPRE
jgi:two-component system, LytTR family, sensor kinase